MPWGLKLWDQEKAISTFTENGVEFTNKVRHFVTAFAQLEATFAKETRKLVKQYTEPPKRDDKELSTSSNRAWAALLQEMDDVGKQHESISEGLMEQVAESLKNNAKEVKAEKQRRSTEYAGYQAELDKMRKKFDAAKRQFDKCSKDAGEALARYTKAERDDNIVKSKIEKARVEKDKLASEADAARRELHLVTDQLRQAQQQFYQGHTVEVFDALERLEIDRVRFLSGCMSMFVRKQREVLPFISKCLDNIEQSVSAMDGVADAEQFQEAMVTGLHPPDVSAVAADPLSPGSALSVQKINERRVNKSKLFHTTTRKKDAVREDFGHLPPEQRRKALQKRLLELEDEQRRDQKTLDALAKTVELYTVNPSLGDAKTLEKAKKELQGLQGKMEKTKLQVYKFQLYTSALEGTAPPEPIAGATAADFEDGEDDDFDDDEEYECAAAAEAAPPPPPPAPAAAALRKAQALYAFEGSKDGELPVQAGDVLTVVEDDGSGWLLAELHGRQGYLPLSYVQMLS